MESHAPARDTPSTEQAKHNDTVSYQPPFTGCTGTFPEQILYIFQRSNEQSKKNPWFLSSQIVPTRKMRTNCVRTGLAEGCCLLSDPHVTVSGSCFMSHRVLFILLPPSSSYICTSTHLCQLQVALVWRSIYIRFLTLCIYAFIYVSIHLSTYLSVCLSVYLSILLFFYLFIYLSIYPSIYPSIYLSTYLPILSICLSI